MCSCTAFHTCATHLRDRRSTTPSPESSIARFDAMSDLARQEAVHKAHTDELWNNRDHHMTLAYSMQGALTSLIQSEWMSGDELRRHLADVIERAHKDADDRHPLPGRESVATLRGVA